MFEALAETGIELSVDAGIGVIDFISSDGTSIGLIGSLMGYF